MHTKTNELISDYGCTMENKSFTPKQLAILDAARELFSEKGYSSTTTLEIAKKAQTSEKTLFKYFPTKQILFNHIFYPCLMTLLEKKTPVDLAETTTLYTMLFDLFKEKIALSDENPELFKLLLHQVLCDNRLRSVFFNFWNTHYLPSLKEQLNLSEEKKALYDPILEQSLSRIIFSLLIGYSVTTTLLDSSQSYDNHKEIGLMLDILFDGIHGLQKTQSL